MEHSGEIRRGMIYDYFCPVCGISVEKFVNGNEVVRCDLGHKMVREEVQKFAFTPSNWGRP